MTIRIIKKKMGKRWIPLEANPEVLDSYARKLGIDNIKEEGYSESKEGDEFRWCDVYGLDEALLAMVPQPVLAVVLLFPLTGSSEAQRLQELENADSKSSEGSSVYYMKQTIENACGTIALLHSIGNNLDRLEVRRGSFLDGFLSATRDMSPIERGSYLENPPEEAISIDSIHENAAREGVTSAPSIDEQINLHFVAFVQHDEKLYELDGRQAGPICHSSSCSKNTFLADVARVIQSEYIEKSDALSFNVMALAGSSNYSL